MSSCRDFAGKVVIVTGSSSGIGEATAILFASRGASVTLCGRNADKLAAAKQRCLDVSPAGSGARFHTVRGDVTEEKVRESIVDETVSVLGKLDVLVANAALNVGAGTICGTTQEDYVTIMDAGVKAVFFLLQRAIPHLEKNQGNVVAISSTVADRVWPGAVVYSISKAAIDHLVRTFSMDLAPKGVRMNSVKPGFIPTNFFRFLGNEEVKDAMMAQVGPSIPLRRAGTPQEVGEAVVFLASQAARYITGSSLHVDGGLCHSPISIS